MKGVYNYTVVKWTCEGLGRWGFGDETEREGHRALLFTCVNRSAAWQLDFFTLAGVNILDLCVCVCVF
jgi:hypothetical protein